MTGAAGWAGWAIGGVSSLTSKVYSKATTKAKPAPGKTQTPVCVLMCVHACAYV